MTDRPKPNASHLAGALATLVVVAALLVAGFASNTLHLSGASTKSQTANTLSARNGTLQARAKADNTIRVQFLGPFAHRVKGIRQCGPAVKVMEGALKRKGFRKTPPGPCVGLAAKRQIIAFQKSIHYKPTGIYTLAVHQQLVRRGGYDKQARTQIAAIAHVQYRLKLKHNILVIGSHAITVGGSSLAYSQSSSRSYFPPWPRLPPATDCSGFVIWWYYQAGVGAAVGYYGPGSSVGWTGTLLHQGILVRGKLQVGDMVIYYGHVEMYIGHGMTEGHGSVGVHLHAYNYRPIDEIRRVF